MALYSVASIRLSTSWGIFSCILLSCFIDFRIIVFLEHCVSYCILRLLLLNNFLVYHLSTQFSQLVQSHSLLANISIILFSLFRFLMVCIIINQLKYSFGFIFDLLFVCWQFVKYFSLSRCVLKKLP